MSNQLGSLIIDKSIAIRDGIDTSIVDISDLSGIKFRLIAKENIIDYADGSLIYEAGAEVGIYNLNEVGKLKIDNLPMGHYELEEIETLPGLVLDNTKYDIVFTQEDTIKKVYTETREIENNTTVVEFSKTDITGKKELVGAKLTVTDENNEIIDSWVSSEKTHKIEGLVVGKEYTLTEEITPDEFVKATSIKFKIENTSDIQKVVMIDKQVTMTKTDIGGNEVEGAELKVVDKEENIVDSWISGKEDHKIKGLIEGETYTLYEDYAPDGFVISNSVEFTVTSDKETQKVQMIDKRLAIRKTDFITGNEVEGAELEITDKDGNVIDSWTSGKEEHFVTGLMEGETYTLTEKTCPYGYEVAESIEFTVSEDKETQRIEMKDMPILNTIKLIKMDSETKETIKAKFKFGIYEDPECTKLIREVKSDKKSGTVTFEDLRYGTYFIKELKAPKGYELSNEIIKVEINDTGVYANGELLEESESIYTFNFYNKQIPKINTGLDINYTLLISCIVISLAGIISGIVMIKRKKQKNN